MSATVSMQRYAAEIFRLEEASEYAALSDVADEVHVSLQAASRMIRRLKKAGLLLHEPYKGVKLTERGRREAMKGLRRHRLAERYLVDVMGFGWDEVHDLTHDFEEGISQPIEDRIDQILGHPTRCPHGEPIPGRDGKMPHLGDFPIIALSDGVRGTISRVRAHDPEKLNYLAELGLTPGADVTLISLAPFEGPVRLQIGPWKEQVIGHHLAQALWLTPSG